MDPPSPPAPPTVCWSRRRFLAGAGAGAATSLGYGVFIERRLIEFTHHEAGLPRAGRRTLTVAHLSDLHMSGLGPVHERIAREIATVGPAIIALTGDSIDRADRLGALSEFLALLPPDTPKYAVLGNWEHWARVDVPALARVHERHGGALLVNRSVLDRSTPRPFRVTGVDDLAGAPDLKAALSGQPPASPHLLLAHSPLYRDHVEADLAAVGEITDSASRADREQVGTKPIEPTTSRRHHLTLVLSGHTHGGQVNLLGLNVRPRGSGRYVKGWYRDLGPPPMYVSRGVGTSVFPIRVGARPEVAFIDVPVE